MEPAQKVQKKAPKKNILIIMADQITGTLFPDGPVDWLHVPNLRKLAARSTCFKNAYTASPLCSPSRASFMTGLLPSRTRVYDNAADFASDIPTFAHHLRKAGYQTCLSGKMHFVGPDQLHGFEERLTTDIYPSDYGWTPDYRKPGERIDWWYHNMGSVTGAGVAEISNQLEFDDEVAFHAVQKLYDLGRGADDRPWCLTVSFTHPHDPYVARRKFWDLYENCEHLEPEVAEMAFEQQDPHSKRVLGALDRQSFEIKREDIRRSRRAYFANISYVDEKVGELLQALEATRQEASIFFVADHGDMLGERGLWFKMSFFEGSARVPLMVSDPDMPVGLNETPVSNIDVAATLASIAGIAAKEMSPWTEGESLQPVAKGHARSRPVPMEYAAEGSYAPMVSLREGRYKYNRCALDPDQLFDLVADPHELKNLAEEPAHKEALERLRKQAEEKWDLKAFDAQVRESQAKRWVVYDSLRQGRQVPWDFQPHRNASDRYMRNHKDLNVLEGQQRFPRGE